MRLRCSLATSGASWRCLPGCKPRLYSSNAACELGVAARPVQAHATNALLPKDVAEDVKKAMQRAERAINTWSLETTDFVSPPVAIEAKRQIDKWADVSCIAWGGYAAAERCRLVVGRDEVMYEPLQDRSTLDCIAALQVSGNFMFEAASHRDFLGSVLGTGIERRCVGDVLVQGDRGAQLLCLPDMASHLQAELTQVRNVPVEVSEMPLAELKVPAPWVQEIKSIEASLRIDAIASAGFRTSRSKMLESVKKGDVRVNWLPCTKPSAEVAAGDMIACAGKGRVEVKNIEETKKGKFAVEMVRYT